MGNKENMKITMEKKKHKNNYGKKQTENDHRKLN